MTPRFIAAWIALVVTVNTAFAAPSPYSTVADLTTSSNALQTQINGKQAVITGATDLTANSLTLGTTNVTGALAGKQPTGTYIKADGTVAFSANQSLGGFTIQNVANPSASGDVANKAYVDATAQGLSVKEPAIAATTAALPTVNYSNGTAGVGATLTESGNGALSVDGQSPNNGDRVLIKNQVSEFQNGIYEVTDKGSAGTQFILTRTTDNDTEAKLVSAFCLVTTGTTNALTGWVQITQAPITVGATNIVWAQFSAAGQVTAGPGLALNGTQMYATNIVGNQIVASATLTTPNIGAATGTSLVMGGTNVVGELAGKQPNITTSTDLTPHSVVMGGTNVIGALAGKQDSGWTITVNGTANRVTASGSPVSPGGTLTLTGPQNISTNDSPTFADVVLGGVTNVAGALAGKQPTITSGTDLTAQSLTMGSTNVTGALAGKAPAFTTGVGITNVANVISLNASPGSNVTFTTNSNGQVDIAAGSGAASTITDGAGIGAGATLTPGAGYTVSSSSATPTFGALSLGTNPSSAGSVRLPNLGWISSRDTANGADLNLWRANGSNYLDFGTAIFRDSFGVYANRNSWMTMYRDFSTPHDTGTDRDSCVALLYQTKQSGTVSDGRAGIAVTPRDRFDVTNVTVSATANNGSGLIRITTSGNHTFHTGDKIAVYGVVGTTEANGSWTITVIDTTHFDLQGSTFANAWVSGGIATNRSLFYAFAASVVPTFARGGLTGTAAHADDVACFVGYNGGTAKGTDAYYLGHNPAIVGDEWNGSFTMDAFSAWGLIMNGTYSTAGIDTSRATMSSAQGVALKLGSGHNVQLDTTNGTKIGTATTEKLAFYNSTPIVQPSSATDTRAALINLGLIASGGAAQQTPDIQTFTNIGPNTWTEPAGAKMVQILLIAGGGGGGSGRKGLTNTVRCGGGGGGGGGYVFQSIPATFISSPVTITVGGGGPGASAQSGASTDGSAGTRGTNTTFGTLFAALGGGGGAGGTATTGTGGTGNSGNNNGGTGGSASTTGGGGQTAGNSVSSGAGGGAGAGLTVAEAVAGGSNGGINAIAVGQTGGTGGTSGGNGGNGTAVTANLGTGGPGGGGGASSKTTNAGDGGVGGSYGAGGGGGGAAEDGVGNSGKGGDGAPGIAIVITYF